MLTSNKPRYLRVSAKIEKIVSAFIDPMKSALEKMERKVGAQELASRKISDAFNASRRSVDKNLRDMAKDLQEHFGTVQAETSDLKSALNSGYRNIEQIIGSNRAASDQMQRSINENLVKLAEIVGDLRNFSIKKGEDVRRWQEGYDWRILKNFVTGILFVLYEMDREISEAKNAEVSEKLIYFRDFLLEELASSGIRRFGDEFVEEKKPTSSPKATFVPIETKKQELDGIVTRVLDYGYEYDDGNGKSRMVKNARLEFFRYTPDSQTEDK